MVYIVIPDDLFTAEYSENRFEELFTNFLGLEQYQLAKELEQWLCISIIGPYMMNLIVL